jgi:putative redox protein
MSEIDIRLLDRSRCQATHRASGQSIDTDVAPEYGGSGSRYSSTDLVAAALGTCIGSSIAPILEREGLPLDAVSITVTKELQHQPRRISRLAVTISLPAAIDDKQLLKLRNAARTCVVHRSLREEVEVTIELAAGR